MKLLYLYVETWPARRITKRNPLEVNFDCGYKFHYDSKTNKLTCEIGNELPENFFSVSSPRACVDSVSVIIGDNGAGKTTIASIFGYLFQLGKHLPEYICIYKQDKRLVLYYHFESGRQTPDYSSIAGEWVDAETDSRYSDISQHNSPFDIVYYSPYFSTNEVWPGKVIANTLDYPALHLFDISTGYLTQHQKNIDRNINKILAYRTEDQERILNFAHKYVNTLVQNGRRRGAGYYKLGPILPLPIYAQLRVKPIALTKLAMSDYFKLPINNEEQEDWRDSLSDTLCTNPMWVLVSEMVARVFLAENVRKKRDIDMLKKILADICREAKRIFTDAPDVSRFDDFAKYVRNIDVSRAGEVGRTLRKVLSPLARLYGNVKRLKQTKDGYILEGQVDISDKEDYDNIIDAVRHMSRLESLFGDVINMQEPLMDITLANMSSGEMSYWTLFARIDELLDLMSRNGDAREILLFLDEAETTLHPEWQRQLVRNIIWFFEKYANGRHVHIIFATHSPMILSDVPKGNIVFLGESRTPRLGKICHSPADKQKPLNGMLDTFGANIFDLYRHPFFMQNGTVAAFAAKKLNDLTKKIHAILVDNKDRKISKEEWFLAETVGDPQARKYFESVKPLLGAALVKKG